MISSRTLICLLAGATCVALAGCQQASGGTAAAAEKDAGAPPGVNRLGIRPNGDTEAQIDMSKVANDDLKKVFSYIDDHLDEHVENLQKWIQQPSVSNSGEGIPESAEMVKGFFDQLGCQESRVYDVGTTEWGSQGNPVVYARCDEGAEKTVVIYWMYDTMPVTQPDAWIVPPFEGRLVEQAPFKKVLIGRGATNSKGPQMAHGDVEMKVIGDVPWAKMRYDTDIAEALKRTDDAFGIRYGRAPSNETILGPYWPAYLFTGAPLDIPIVGGQAGHGGNAHAANEYYVIEGAGRVYGIAGSERSVAMVLYNFAGKNGAAPVSTN